MIACYAHLHCTRLARPRRIAAERAKRSAVQVLHVTHQIGNCVSFNASASVKTHSHE
jgi:hypothetical protein